MMDDGFKWFAFIVIILVLIAFWEEFQPRIDHFIGYEEVESDQQ